MAEKKPWWFEGGILGLLQDAMKDDKKPAKRSSRMDKVDTRSYRGQGEFAPVRAVQVAQPAAIVPTPLAPNTPVAYLRGQPVPSQYPMQVAAPVVPEFVPGQNVAEQAPGGIASVLMARPGASMTQRGSRLTPSMLYGNKTPVTAEPAPALDNNPLTAAVDAGGHPPPKGIIQTYLPETYRMFTEPGYTPPIIPGDATAKPHGGGPNVQTPDAPVQLPDPKADPYVPTPEQAKTVEQEQVQKDVETAISGGSNTDLVRKVLDGIDPTPDNPKQNEADAYAERQLSRDKMLAQLALAAGVARSGGAGWSDIAGGLEKAGGAYDAGFERYQSALQKSADRYAERQGKDMDFEKSIRLAGFEMDREELKAKREAQRDVRREALERITKGAEKNLEFGTPKMSAEEYAMLSPEDKAIYDQDIKRRLYKYNRDMGLRQNDAAIDVSD